MHAHVSKPGHPQVSQPALPSGHLCRMWLEEPRALSLPDRAGENVSRDEGWFLFSVASFLPSTSFPFLPPPRPCSLYLASFLNYFLLPFWKTQTKRAHQIWYLIFKNLLILLWAHTLIFIKTFCLLFTLSDMNNACSLSWDIRRKCNVLIFLNETASVKDGCVSLPFLMEGFNKS